MSTQDPIREAAMASEGAPSEEEHLALSRPTSGYRPKRGLMIGVAVFGAVVLGVVLMSMLQSTPSESPVAAPPAVQPSATQPAVAAVYPPTLPASPPNVDGLTPREGAGALRRDAVMACKAAQWQRCRNDVEQAALLDPENDKVPAVQRLHHAAEQGHF